MRMCFLDSELATSRLSTAHFRHEGLGIPNGSRPISGRVRPVPGPEERSGVVGRSGAQMFGRRLGRQVGGR